MKQGTVLIAGGAGFIGSHLCDEFLKQGYRVICIDNLITGSLNNIKQHKSDKRFRFIKHDISWPIKIPGKIDYVLNFASPASPKDYEELPLETLKVGSLGTLNLLEVARQKKARFVMASTSEIYGDPLVSPQREDYWGNVNTVGPRSCYDEAKRFAEAATTVYYDKYGVDARIIRIFNTFGPRMRRSDGRVVPNFIMQALTGRSLTVYGDGRQTRSFCYVSDLVAGIHKLMRKRGFGPGIRSRIFNLGNPVEFTILELTGVFSKLFKSKRLKIVRSPLPVDDPKQRRPDIAKAKAELGWQPVVGLEAGLQKTIEYFRPSLLEGK